MISCVWSLRCLKLLSDSYWRHCFWFTMAQRVLQCSASAMEDEGRRNSLWRSVVKANLSLFLPTCLDEVLLWYPWVSARFLSLVLQMSHAAVSGLCRAIKLQCELYSSRQIAICLDPYCGLGFVLWCLCRYDFWGGKRKGLTLSWL